MRVMVEVLPDGNTRIASPGLTVPLEMRPEKPRKSKLGRFTHCTAMRNGRSCIVVVSNSTFSRCDIKVGPVYHVILVDCVVMLSPLKPLMGMGTNVVIPMLLA